MSVIQLFLYPEYSKVIRKSSLKWVQCACVSKISGFQLRKLIAILEEVLLGPMFSKIYFNNQASFIRGYVSTITYTLYNILTIRHLSFTLETPTKEQHPYKIIITSALL